MLTRNASYAVEEFMTHLQQQCAISHARGGFACVLTRDFQPFKPDPAALLHIAREWNLTPEQLVMVGDAKDDMLCGRHAGVRTVLLRQAHNEAVVPLADIVVESLTELTALLQRDTSLVS